MKILYLITGLGGGGAEKVVVDLAEQMLTREHEIKIAYLKGQVIVRPENIEIDLVCLGLDSVKQSISAYKNYRKLLNDFQPDVIHAHMVHANIFARLSRLFFPTPKLICTAHNSNEGGLLRQLAYRYTDYLSDLNTNVSYEATEKFIKDKAFKKDAITIYNGINLSKFHKNHLLDRSDFVEEEAKIILAVGRFNIQKDYINLLQAIKLLKNNIDIKFKLLIAGDGELRSLIEAKIIEFGLTKEVVLLGRRNDIPDLMSVADLFILSSAWEGFGLVVAEAMACEAFVIATDCGGVKEVMGGHGILIPPKNSIALAEAIKLFFDKTPDEILLNNTNALTYVKDKFALEKIVNGWIKIYES